jgi:hypothetical protein
MSDSAPMALIEWVDLPAKSEETAVETPAAEAVVDVAPEKKAKKKAAKAEEAAAE